MWHVTCEMLMASFCGTSSIEITYYQFYDLTAVFSDITRPDNVAVFLLHFDTKVITLLDGW